MNVDLNILTAQNTGGSGTDTLTTENLTGSVSTTLRGDAGANVVTGGAGNDVIEGRAGADTLLGGDGNDSLDGGDDDVCCAAAQATTRWLGHGDGTADYSDATAA